MLSAKHRLRLRSVPDFFAEASRFSTPHLVWYVQRVSTDESKATVIVPKSVEGRAVYRNRLKRRLHQMLSSFLSSQSKIHIVGIVKKHGGKSPFNPYDDIATLSHFLHS